MRESLMIRPFVELEDSFLCTWPPHLEGLPFCFHEYYPGIPVREWEGKFWEKLSPSKIEVANRDPRRRFVDTNFILRIFEGGKGGDVVDVDWRYEVRSRVQS